MEEGSVDPVHELRIRIPPFQEIEDHLVIPAWPRRLGTDENKLRIDLNYINMLLMLEESRKELRDQLHVSSEIMKYLYTYSRTCSAQLDLAHKIYFKVGADMGAAEDIEDGYTSTTKVSAERIRQRVYYYGRKLKTLLHKILYLK